MTTVVIHGSALTTPATARDVDVIYVGDRAIAERVARGWAADHGFGALPLDIHEAQHGSIRVPTPRGEERPFLRVAGDAPVESRPVDGLAAAMRRADFDLAAFDAAFSDVGDGCRFGLTDGDDGSAEWAAYVEGPAALRSALRHVRPEAWAAICRARPERAAFIEALTEHGASHLSADLLRDIGGQAGGSPQKHIRVTEASECAPLYSRRVGPWSLGFFTAMLRGEAAVADVVVRQISGDDGEAWLRRVGAIPEGAPVVALLDADLTERVRGKTVAFVTATRADITLPQMALARSVLLGTEAAGERSLGVYVVRRAAGGGEVIARPAVVAAFAAELAELREVNDVDGSVALHRVARALGFEAELCP